MRVNVTVDVFNPVAGPTQQVLNGLMYVPRTACTRSKYPAVVALHDASWMWKDYAVTKDRSRGPLPAYCDMINQALNDEFVVLFVDSFDARKTTASNTTVPTVSIGQRMSDAWAGVSFLRTNAGLYGISVDSARIYALG